MARRRRITLTTQIFIGLFLGVAVGAVIHHAFGANPEAVAWVRVLSRVFLALIKVIIGPLILATLVVGIAGAGNPKEAGRVGLKAIIYFEIVTTLALAIGFAAVNLVRPGDGVNLPPETGVEAREMAGKAAKLTAQDHIVNIFTTSLPKAMAENEILQIVVFALIFAMALVAAGEKGRPVLTFLEGLSEVMFKFTNLVMRFAPWGVGAAMAVTVGSKGLDVLKNLALLIGTLYGSLFVFIVFVLGSVALIIRLPLREFLRQVKEPVLLAFTTTSSEAALPRAMENMETFGVPRRIVGFVMPLGYSFNLDGSSLYLSLAAVFVAQAANVELGAGQQILMLLTLMLTSKGVAGVPRASLVILSGTLVSFGLPLEGVAIVLGVDEILDMARTATNVLGNCLATVAVAKWEGKFREPPQPLPALPPAVSSPAPESPSPVP